MKEEAPTKKLPPKMNGGEVTASTPTKAAHDEILSSLLRINNFDSISSIKDESLDIDLSACVTISPAGLMNGNSLSSTDFWRVLDESAQNAELNLSSDGKEELIRSSPSPSPIASNVTTISTLSNGNDNQSSEFNVTFLRPEPPNAFTNSPFKKGVSTTPVKHQLTDVQQQNQPQTQLLSQYTKVKLPAATTLRLKVFKEEPPEDPLQPQQQPIQHRQLKQKDQLQSRDKTANCAANVTTKSEVSESEVVTAAFSIFQKPKPTNELNPMQVGSETQKTQKSGEKTLAVTEIKVLPTYKCLDCNGLVLNAEEVSTHEAISHRTRLFYKCGECEREFDLLTGLKKHLKSHRSEGRKDTWKKCPDCGKCLKLGSMWMHRKIHSDNKKYVCDICGQKFVQKINLTHHARIHSSEKPYECPECQKRFQERSHLQRHQKYHAQTRSYRCEKCGKMYKTERCLKVHNLVHLEQRPFACNVCDKSFISNSKLKQHSNIHTGMRPFKCNYCPRDFTNFPNWLKHTRRRHKVDHKTGEQLENIPSYCSKKSSTKSQRATAAEPKDQVKVNGTATSVPNKTPTSTPSNMPNTFATAVPTMTMPLQISSHKDSATKAIQTPTTTPTVASTTQTKSARKKKQPQQANTPAVVTTVTSISTSSTTPAPQFTNALPESRPQQIQSQAATINSIKRTVPNNDVNRAAGALVAPPKQTKPKRERKQLTPKQVQKQPIQVPPAPTISTVTISPQTIKKEPLQHDASKALPGQFLDLHSLSLTSAEELIMEQALEMEECGLYDTPVADIGTDNAISSETAAALHFQIKNEINDELIKEEEFITIKKNERLACPSLESSPFSSPASIEMSSVASTNATSTATSYYMPTFALNAQGTILTGLRALNGTTANNKANVLPSLISTSTPTVTPAAGVAANSSNIKQQNAARISTPPSTPTPTSMSSLLMRSTQMLPSVDTLLFSTHAGSRFFQGKTTTAPAQQNLSS